jgi:hypothetical protein
MKKINLLKKTILIFSILIGLNSIYAQNPFLGTWKHINGAETFYVTFYNDFENNKIRGDYKLVTIDSNNIIQEIYKSNKLIDGINEWPSCIFMSTDYSGNYIKGNITDNTIDFSTYNPNRTFKTGILTVKLLNGCMGCPLTAEWKIIEPQGIQIEGEPDYNIPTDIILTKVN